MDQEKNKSNKEIPEFLQRFQHDEGFSLPKDFFASMQDNVLNEVLDHRTDSATEKSSWQFFKMNINWVLQPQYALAGIAAIVLIGLTIGISTSEPTSRSAFDDLSRADLEYYIDANIEDMNSQEFYTALASYNFEASLPISTINVPSEIADEYFEELDDSEFLEFQYLDKD